MSHCSFSMVLSKVFLAAFSKMTLQAQISYQQKFSNIIDQSSITFTSMFVHRIPAGAEVSFSVKSWKKPAYNFRIMLTIHYFECSLQHDFRISMAQRRQLSDNLHWKIFKIGRQTLYSKREAKEQVCVTNVSLRMFKKIVKEKRNQVYAVVINNMHTTNHHSEGRQQIQEWRNSRRTIGRFQFWIAPGLQSKRPVDHEIVTDPEAKISNRRLFACHQKNLVQHGNI